MRIQHVITGFGLSDIPAVEQAIRLSEEKYCSGCVGMPEATTFNTTYQIVEEKTEWIEAADLGCPKLIFWNTLGRGIRSALR